MRMIDSPCECEYNNLDSPGCATVPLRGVSCRACCDMDEAPSLLWYLNRDAASMITAGAAANTTERNSRASRGIRVVVSTFTRGIYRSATRESRSSVGVASSLCRL